MSAKVRRRQYTLHLRRPVPAAPFFIIPGWGHCPCPAHRRNAPAPGNNSVTHTFIMLGYFPKHSRQEQSPLLNGLL